VVVRHFPHSERRVSGLAAFAADLLARLAPGRDLHVVCGGPRERALRLARRHGYHAHPAPWPFWLRAPGVARSLRPRAVLVLSGLHKARFLYPVFRPLASLDGPRKLFYQCVAMDHAPGRLGQRMLTRFDDLLSADPAPDLPACRHLPPGVDLDRIRAARPAPRTAPFRVGFFNHLNRLKGCDVAVQAFAELGLPDAELVVAGTGEMADELRALWHGRGGIRFVGYLEDPLPELRACDALVLPFRGAVSVLGVSQAVLAALAAGVPVVGSDVPAITGAVRHEREGLIAASPDEVGPCIRRLHDDPELRRALAASAARRSEAFSIEHTAERLAALLDEDAT
jgi:glycosyltransferase involved in cell wall biosynthesis